MSKKKPKNELWINAGYNFLYYETDKTTVDEAYEEFEEKLASIGCCADNFPGRCDFELKKYDDDDGPGYKVIDKKYNYGYDY